jgi:hypothetical protein
MRGSSAAALYGIVAGSLREPYPLYGMPFGAGSRRSPLTGTPIMA